MAAVTVAWSSGLVLAVLLAEDIYLHHRYAHTTYNIWGYRGPAVGRKHPAELRLALLGGSVAFGLGRWDDQSIAAYLERKMNARLPSGRSTTVVNLGWPNEGAYSFVYTLRDYAYLQYDGVILYSGYNDLSYNTKVFRHESAVFRLTGYRPILPLILAEKAMFLRYGPDAAERGGQTVFRGGVLARSAATLASGVVDVSEALNRQLDRLTTDTSTTSPSSAGSSNRWHRYQEAVDAAVAEARRRGVVVFVVTEPYLSPVHKEQQRALAQMVTERYAGDRTVHYVNLGPTLDLRDRSLCFDGVHLTERGNERIADALLPEVERAFAGGLPASQGK